MGLRGVGSRFGEYMDWGRARVSTRRGLVVLAAGEGEEEAQMRYLIHVMVELAMAGRAAQYRHRAAQCHCLEEKVLE